MKIKKINEVSFYGSFYLVLILIFSIIYTFLKSNHFYSNSLVKEKSFENLKNELTTDLNNLARTKNSIVNDAIFSNDFSFLKTDNDTKILQKDFQIHFFIKILNISTSSIDFLIIKQIFNNTVDDKKVFIYSSILEVSNVDNINGNHFKIQEKEIENKENQKISDIFIKSIFPNSNNIISKKMSIMILSEFPKKISDKFNQLINMKNGYSNRNDWEDFFRMLYFSVITQTTLGYGDIIPISDTARFLISFQSILGIIIIGLFLNAIAKESGKTLEEEKILFLDEIRGAVLGLEEKLINNLNKHFGDDDDFNKN